MQLLPCVAGAELVVADAQTRRRTTAPRRHLRSLAVGRDEHRAERARSALLSMTVNTLSAGGADDQPNHFFAHGSRDPNWRRPFDAILAGLPRHACHQAGGAGPGVHDARLLPAAYRPWWRRATQIRVIPLFLRRGRAYAPRLGRAGSTPPGQIILRCCFSVPSDRRRLIQSRSAISSWATRSCGFRRPTAAAGTHHDPSVVAPRSVISAHCASTSARGATAELPNAARFGQAR